MAPKVQKTMRYEPKAMKDALEAVANGMSELKASKTFGVPRTTLHYKRSGVYPVECRKGPATNLSAEEEDFLVKGLFHIGDCGFPATKLQLIDSVELLITNLKRHNNFTNGRPGKKWFASFLKRHPELTQRMSQNLSSARSSLTEKKIRSWFSEVKTYMTEQNHMDIFTDPRRVFNADETAFFLSPKGKKVLVKKGDTAVYTFINNDEKECLTTLVTANAAGMLAPPMVVYAYERIPSHIANLLPDGWGVGKSENGWMTGQTFYEFVTNIFYKWLVDQNIPLPVVFFVDGHRSHLAMPLSDFCLEKGIILVALYPNATHILQPLDVAVFHPLKTGWKDGVHQWKLENQGRKLGREHFAPLLKTVMTSCITSNIVASGFKACGLCPFDDNAVDFKKFFRVDSGQTIPTAQFSRPVLQMHLNFLETLIPPETLVTFREHGSTWSGRIEDTSLWGIWKHLQLQLEKDINNSNADILDTNSFEETEHNTTENPDCETRGPCHDIEPTPVPSTSTDVRDKFQVPSPFKKSLFWPITSKSAKPTRFKEKIPSVATSNQWREYHLKKQQLKETQEQEKEERKRKWEEKKASKETLKKKTKTKKSVEDWSSDSSCDIVLESEGEGDDWGVLSTDQETNLWRETDHVIVKYEGEFFPGIIEEIEGDAALISVMVMSGISSWKWPTSKDRLWYPFVDIKQNIKPPLSMNSRGIYRVPEMKKYRDFVLL